MQFVLLVTISVLATIAVVSASSYGYNYLPPPVQPPRNVNSCNECRSTTTCETELDIRDSTVPQEVPIPYVDYQIAYKEKPVEVVTDFDVVERPCPVPVQLQDKRVHVTPVRRQVEKVVVVRVPRVTEKVVVKKLDRVRIVTETRQRPKLVNILHVEQVLEENRVVLPKEVAKIRLLTQTNQIRVPVRITNEVVVHVVEVDKPIPVPSIQYKFCENVQEIKVKSDCPPAKSY